MPTRCPDTGYLRRTTQLINHNRPYSMIGWYRREHSLTAWKAVACLPISSNQDAISISNGLLNYERQIGGSYQSWGSSPASFAITPSVWYYVGYIYDGTNCILMKDARYWRVGAGGDVSSRSACTGLQLNAWNGSFFADHAYYNWMFFQRPLCEMELREQMRSFCPLSTQNLLGWYPVVYPGDYNSQAGGLLPLSVGGSGTFSILPEHNLAYRTRGMGLLVYDVPGTKLTMLRGGV